MGAKATQPRKRLGAWLARSIDTVYQAATDGIVCVTAIGNSVSSNIQVKTDGSNPPTSLRVSDEGGLGLELGYVDIYFCHRSKSFF